MQKIKDVKNTLKANMIEAYHNEFKNFLDEQVQYFPIQLISLQLDGGAKLGQYLFKIAFLVTKKHFNPEYLKKINIDFSDEKALNYQNIYTTEFTELFDPLDKKYLVINPFPEALDCSKFSNTDPNFINDLYDLMSFFLDDMTHKHLFKYSYVHPSLNLITINNLLTK